MDVFIKLLANAVKFTPDGGAMRIVARAGGPDRRGVRVEVRDEGVGVPAGEHPYLFDPFFTGFDTLRHSSGELQFSKQGIGLGLCLVRSFVEMHGGKVEFQSEPGQGSTFVVILPASTPAPSGERAALANGTRPSPSGAATRA